MKLRRLVLQRYGHLSDVALDFAEDTRLCVVHGANEAGKTTALSAITDALFGFDHRTAFDFLHGGPQLRIGFTLQSADGATEDFQRRKGRSDTLRNGQEEKIPDASLRRFLGDTTRDMFESIFGLNGERLREGGHELLESGGDAGESLLSSTGLPNLRAALNALEDEAKSLVGDGRGKRKLSEAVEAFRLATREMEERAVAPRAWQEADTAHTQAIAALSETQERARALAAEESRLQRVRRVAPRLAELDAARSHFAAHEHAPNLPADAETRLQAASKNFLDGERDQNRETTEATRLKESLSAIQQDSEILAAQDAIDALTERRALVAQATTDFASVRANMAAHRAKMTDALDDLHAGITPENAREAIPAAPTRKNIQRLVSEHAALTATTTAAEQALNAATRRRDDASAALKTQAPSDPALLRRTIDSVRAEGPLDTEIHRAEQNLAEATRKANAALAALPLWTKDAPTLSACPIPLPAAAEKAASTLDFAKKSLTEAETAFAKLNADIAESEADAARAAQGETVPTTKAVAAARATRDRVWTLLHRQLNGGPKPSSVELEGLPDGNLPDEFKTLLDEADKLADRRADDAKRVADFLAATDRAETLKNRGPTTESALATAKTKLEAASNAWTALWQPAGIVPDAPPVMADWRRARAEIVRLTETEAELGKPYKDLHARRTRARTALAKIVDCDKEEPLATILLRAETQCATAEAETNEHRKRADALTREETQLPKLADDLKSAQTKTTQWQAAWAKALTSLQLPAETNIQAAEAALSAWARIGEIAPLWRSDEIRVADMQATITEFTEETSRVQTRIGDPKSEEPATTTIARLSRRLATARKAASEATSLDKRMEAHKTAATKAANQMNLAEQDLAALRAQANVTDNAALETAIKDAREKHRAAQEIDRISKLLLTEGDGQTETSLRAEASTIDRDTAAGRLAEIQAERESLTQRREALTAKRTLAETELAKMRQGGDAAVKAQEAENALADARTHAERYARVHVARVLLKAGIEKFRAEQQGPLLRTAGTHFSLLTAGRYARLGVEKDGSGRKILVGVRNNGQECPVEALSEGTRDQLYLALRVAAIEAHAATAEPIPFIADDLLVHFDDTRAAAAMALLAELGRTTQVILFTHHDHIANLALHLLGAEIQTFPAVT